jgi:hypothetical protein
MKTNLKLMDFVIIAAIVLVLVVTVHMVIKYRTVAVKDKDGKLLNTMVPSLTKGGDVVGEEKEEEEDK